MKNTFPPFARLIALVACVVSLGSCSRSDYAMLPKGASYAGNSHVSTPVSAAPAPAAVANTAPAVAQAPVAAPAAVAKAQPAATAQPAAIATAKAPRLNLVQRLTVKALVNKAKKSTSHANTASTQKIEGNLRTAILLGAIGLVTEILGIAVGSSIIYLIGAILLVVAAVFFILWLVDKL